MSKVLSSVFSRVYIVYVQDLRSGQKVHINADGVIEERSARVARRYISCRINGIRFADEQNRIAVSLQEAFFLLQGRLCLRFRTAHSMEYGHKK